MNIPATIQRRRPRGGGLSHTIAFRVSPEHVSLLADIARQRGREGDLNAIAREFVEAGLAGYGVAQATTGGGTMSPEVRARAENIVHLLTALLESMPKGGGGP